MRYRINQVLIFITALKNELSQFRAPIGEIEDGFYSSLRITFRNIKDHFFTLPIILYKKIIEFISGNLMSESSFDSKMMLVFIWGSKKVLPEPFIQNI